MTLPSGVQAAESSETPTECLTPAAPAGLQGEQGPQGEQGDKGPNGADGMILMQPGPTRAPHPSGGIAPLCTSVDLVCVVAVQGPQGEPGAPGEKGDIGDPGPDGQDAFTIFIGGPARPTHRVAGVPECDPQDVCTITHYGEQGPQGPAGEPGPKGPQGDPGNDAINSFGPSRAPSIPIELVTIQIPVPCQLMILAESQGALPSLPTVGNDDAPLLLIAGGLLLVGGAALVTRRLTRA